MQCDVKERIIRKQETVKVECFKCEEKGHKYRECSLWKGEKKLQVVEEAVHMVMLQRHSKRSRGGVQCMSYNKKHRSTVERAFQMRHAC